MKIYVVVRGEDGEGYTISGIYLTEVEADEHADELMRYGSWEFNGVDEAPFGEPSKVWSWTQGCDYIEMQEWEI